MTRKNDRRNAGLWFAGILGLILTAIGLRYASSSDWWTTAFGGSSQASETINTGANVLMPTPASPAPTPGSTPSDQGLLPDTSPTTPAAPTTDPTPSRKPQMW